RSGSLPPGGAWPRGKQGSEGVQCDRLAQQVRVRREVDREIVVQILPMPVEGAQKTPSDCKLQLRSRQVVDPDPGQRAKRDLQRAGPVHSTQIGICGQPVDQLAFDLLQKFPASAQPERLRQHNQMLMAIELPDRLVIAYA